MGLLQISDPLAESSAVGIDLGTTHSLVAYVAPTGEPVALRVCDDDPLLPSVVHYAADGHVIVGKDALAFAHAYPEETIASVKRFMGRAPVDLQKQAWGPYRFATSEGTLVKFDVGQGRTVTPVEVSAEILRDLKKRAEKRLGEIHDAVITVPAYFDDSQRQATRDAGKLAGLNVLRLLNEPTAAALAYGLDQKKNGLFAVYDLGGGTFDITILALEDGVFQVRSTGGDSQLGGDDMDRALASYMFEKAGIPLEQVQDQSALVIGSALRAARSVKHQLSEIDHVRVEISWLPDKQVVDVCRDEFEKRIAPLLERTALASRRALRDAGIKSRDLDGVILVGGASRVPVVRNFVSKFFEQQPLANIDPDQVVALGAAHQADILTNRRRRDEVLLLDVLPLSLGVEAMGGVVERILSRNTAIPAAASQIFTTYADNQTGLAVHVVQGERELASDCRSLARFTLKGIPPMAAGLARIEVRFMVDENGILTVSAKELSTSNQIEIHVKPSHGLTDQEMEKMLNDAFAHAENDVMHRALREQVVEADRILQAIQKALKQDEALLENNEKEEIARAMKALVLAKEGQDHRMIARSIEALDEVSREFAARRMNTRMRNALNGQDLQKLEQEVATAQGIEGHLGSSQ